MTGQLESSLRAAFNALAPAVKSAGFIFPPADGLDVDSLAGEFRQVADWFLDVVYATERGARHSWKTTRTAPQDWTPEILTVDLDHRSPYDNPDDWLDSPLYRVASAYRRECGWDFAPNESGVWLLTVAPTCKSGGEDEASWRAWGNIIGFVVLQDREEDGEYESVAHVWTATAWRRQRIAAGLLAHARAHYPVGHVEGPATAAGAELIRACVPDLVDLPTTGQP